MNLIHWKTDGFVTVTQQQTGQWAFFVLNGAATLVFTRDNGLPAPNFVYSEDDTTATLTLAPQSNMKYSCTNFYDVREGYPVPQCNSSCQPCVCEVCSWKTIEDSGGLPTLEYGPDAN